jgi:hypothetical protein
MCIPTDHKYYQNLNKWQYNFKVILTFRNGKKNEECEMWGFYKSVVEDSDLLRCYTVSNGQ